MMPPARKPAASGAAAAQSIGQYTMNSVQQVTSATASGAQRSNWRPCPRNPGREPGAEQQQAGTAAAAGPGLAAVAHAVLVLPVVLVTSVRTGLWWPGRSPAATPGRESGAAGGVRR